MEDATPVGDKAGTRWALSSKTRRQQPVARSQRRAVPSTALTVRTPSPSGVRQREVISAAWLPSRRMLCRNGGPFWRRMSATAFSVRARTACPAGVAFGNLFLFDGSMSFGRVGDLPIGVGGPPGHRAPRYDSVPAPPMAQARKPTAQHAVPLQAGLVASVSPA